MEWASPDIHVPSPMHSPSLFLHSFTLSALHQASIYLATQSSPSTRVNQAFIGTVVKIKMKTFSSMLLCLLLTSFHFSSIVTLASASSSSFIVLSKFKETRRELISSNHHRVETHKIQVVDTQTDIRGASREDDDSVDDEGELVYHVDYHGVSTHPTPNPKHPRP